VHVASIFSYGDFVVDLVAPPSGNLGMLVYMTPNAAFKRPWMYGLICDPSVRRAELTFQ
jgi:hypothetical protein